MDHLPELLPRNCVMQVLSTTSLGILKRNHTALQNNGLKVVEK
jgi:hypothetical protein